MIRLIKTIIAVLTISVVMSGAAAAYAPVARKDTGDVRIRKNDDIYTAAENDINGSQELSPEEYDGIKSVDLLPAEFYDGVKSVDLLPVQFDDSVKSVDLLPAVSWGKNPYRIVKNTPK